jgi:23S rRNA (adenine-N6)-dimethyltransferase
MFNQRRRILSQNFLYSRKLVNSLVRRSSIGLNDFVLEIGPGKGIITEELLKATKKILAVELDTELYLYLDQKFKHLRHKLYLINKDFLQTKLPKERYKVFANIPFSIEGKIIRRLLTADNPPVDAYLVMREDLSERLAGIKREGQFSVCHKPFFNFEIVHIFRKADFIPMARMDTVLLRFTQKSESLLLKEDKGKYLKFVGQGFGGGKGLHYNLRLFLTHNQLQKLAHDYDFNPKSKPSDLKVEHWVAIFHFLKRMGKI